jgi:hypothetical protein
MDPYDPSVTYNIFYSLVRCMMPSDDDDDDDDDDELLCLLCRGPMCFAATPCPEFFKQ